MEPVEALHKLVILRVVVAALGETPSAAWWRTQFLTEAGLRATARIFPRTAMAAAINSVCEAARIDHDKKVGVGQRYHLFRLPIGCEDGVAKTLTRQETQAEAKELILSGRDGQLKRLELLAQGSKRVGKEGPVALGAATRISTSEAIAELATNYLRAFASNQKCYPYFEDQEGGV